MTSARRSWRPLLRWLALAGVAVVPAHAGAEVATPSAAPAAGRVHVALRTGFGVPFGRYADVRTLAGVRDEDVNALADDTYGVIPLWLDIGYRLTPHLLLGGYFTYGVVLPRTAAGNDPLGGGCPEGFDCSASGIRFGLQVQYAFAPGHAVNPWLGVAAGYEWIQSGFDGELFSLPVQVSTTHSGPDLLQLQGGADFLVGSGLGVGPFVAASAMSYTACTLELSGDEGPCEIDDASWHGWLVLGVRGVVEL